MESLLKKHFKKLKSVKTSSVRQTKASAYDFAAVLRAGDIIALSGDLGAGKTHFVKGIAKFFGINEKLIASPTFSLIKSYKGKSMTVFHYDFYRLKGIDELERTGYRDYLLEENSLIFVEWPEKVMETWDDFTYMVNIEHLSSTNRNITIYKKGTKKQR